MSQPYVTETQQGLNMKSKTSGCPSRVAARFSEGAERYVTENCGAPSAQIKHKKTITKTNLIKTNLANLKQIH